LPWQEVQVEKDYAALFVGDEAGATVKKQKIRKNAEAKAQQNEGVDRKGCPDSVVRDF